MDYNWSTICARIYFLFFWVQSTNSFHHRRDLRAHPKYPPVFWYPGFPMFSNRTNPARIVVQMHDSLDFFCPDYINSQYQSFSGAKKFPSDYGAEEIYMVNGQDYQSCHSGPDRARISKKFTRLLLRCPGKHTESRIKAKYQYTVSFRMFSPVPKGPEFNCNEEYLFLGIFPSHGYDEEATEKALCSTNALRLQIFVSCSDTPAHQFFDSISSPNVIQLDRPDVLSEMHTTATSKMPSLAAFRSSSVQPIIDKDIDVSSDKIPRPSKTPALYVARSDRKIMQRNDSRPSRRSTLKPTTTIRNLPSDDKEEVRLEHDGHQLTASTFRPLLSGMSKAPMKQPKFGRSEGPTAHADSLRFSLRLISLLTAVSSTLSVLAPYRI